MRTVKAQHHQVKFLLAVLQQLLVRYSALFQVHQRTLQLFLFAQRAVMQRLQFHFRFASRRNVSLQRFGLLLRRRVAKQSRQFLLFAVQRLACRVSVFAASFERTLRLVDVGRRIFNFLAQQVGRPFRLVERVARLVPVVVQVCQSQTDAVRVVLPFRKPSRQRNHVVEVSVNFRASLVRNVDGVLQFLGCRSRNFRLGRNFVQVRPRVSHHRFEF